MTIPSAPPISAGIWPVITEHAKRLVVSQKGSGRAFGASRTSGRIHLGCDLFCTDGDLVVAIADGIVVRNRGIFLQGTRADGSRYKVRRLIVDHGGFLVGYGEVWPTPGVMTATGDRNDPLALWTWHDDFDKMVEGAKVKAGQAFARVTKMRVSSMLHLETWSKPPQPGRAGRWYRGESPPEGLLDPTAMLLALAEDAKSGR